MVPKYLLYFREAVPTWPQLAAVIPTLNAPGRCSRLDGVKGGWQPEDSGDFFLPSFENAPNSSKGNVLLEPIFQSFTCKYGLFFFFGWRVGVLEGGWGGKGR